MQVTLRGERITVTWRQTEHGFSGSWINIPENSSPFMTGYLSRHKIWKSGVDAKDAWMRGPQVFAEGLVRCSPWRFDIEIERMLSYSHLWRTTDDPVSSLIQAVHSCYLFVQKEYEKIIILRTRSWFRSRHRIGTRTRMIKSEGWIRWKKSESPKVRN